MSGEALLLELEFARVERASEPYAFRFAPQDYDLRTPGGGRERARLNWDASLLRGLAALRLPGRDPELLREVGEALRAFVAPLGWERLAEQILDASQKGRRVLVTIRSAAAELYTLPWELLTTKASGQHLGALEGVLLRYEWPGTTSCPEQPVPRRGSGRILVAWSAAGGAVPASRHVQDIEAACRDGCLPFSHELDVVGHASLARLRAVLETAKRDEKPIAVLHLLAHGGAAGRTFGLLLDGSSAGDASLVVDAGQLQQLLAPYAGMIRMVVLAACDSGNSGELGNMLGSLAQTLHRCGIAAVVASRHPLSLSGSNRLTRSLYRGLLVELMSLEDALLTARKELADDAAQLDWASVQLYARAADGHATRPLVFRPYQGLSAFDTPQRRFFFGREALSEKLQQRCQEIWDAPEAPKLLAILGPSGSGKSSVARAGLLARLERQPLASALSLGSVVLKPGAHPLPALDSALSAVASGRSTERVLVLVDQFEEVYTLCTDPAERETFVARLLELARDPAGKAFVILTLRSDFLGETQQHHLELNRLIAEQSVLVGGMSQAELRAAIARPAERVGKPLDEVTIELLLTQAQGSEGALPLLAFTLSLLWEAMLAGLNPSSRLRELGGVGGALAREAHKLYDTLSRAEQATARRALVRLVRLGEGTRDTRRRMPLSDLCGHGETETTVLSVLRRFAGEQARLVTLHGEGSAIVAEVTHETLFEHWIELRTWIEQSRRDRGLHERALEAAKLWQQAGRPAGRLWRPPDLDLLRAYQRDKPEELSPLQTSFLRAALNRQRRDRALGLGAAVTILAALLLAGGVYVLKERQRAQEASAAKESAQQKLLDTYIERGHQLLFESGKRSEGLLWLHRALKEGSKDPALRDLLKSAMQSIDATQAVLIGHTDQVWNAVLSPDGRRIVTAGDDRTARVWDVRTGQSLAVLAGHLDSVRGAAFSSDGRRIVTASWDSTARVWDSESGRLLAELKGHDGKLSSAAFNPDGRRVVTASHDQTARIWDSGSGRLLAELKGHDDMVSIALFSPDGSRVLSASRDNTARLWNADTGRQQLELRGSDQPVDPEQAANTMIFHPDQPVHTAAFSPDGRRIVTANSEGSARVWDAESGRLLVERKGNGQRMEFARFSPDGRLIVTGHADAAVEVWDAETGKGVQSLRGHTGVVRGAGFSPDGGRLVTGSDDRTLRIWAPRSGQLLAVLAAHGAGVMDAAFSPDGWRVVSASLDKTARIWDLDRGDHLLAVLKGHGHAVQTAGFSRDGRRIVTASQDMTARIWDAQTGGTLLELKDPGTIGYSACISPDGRRVATERLDRAVRVWDAVSGLLLVELQGSGRTAGSLSFSSDGLRLLAAGRDKVAWIWDAQTGRLLVELKGHELGINSARFSADGQRVVTSSSDRTARVFESGTGRVMAVLRGHQEALGSAAFSSDRRRVVTASEDMTAVVWDAETGRSLAELKGHSGIVRVAEFNPDGDRVVTGSDDETARIWEAGSGHLLAVLKGHPGQVSQAAFSPNGQRILTASPEQVARVWEARTGRLLTVLLGHGSTLTSAMFSPDGQRILTTSYDKTARLWDIAPEARSESRIAQLIRCHVPAQFEGVDSSVIVFRKPTPTECRGPDPSSAAPPPAQP